MTTRPIVVSLDELVGDRRDKHLDVPVTTQVVTGQPAALLVRASEHAQLVVGSRGRGGPRETRLGSGSQQLVRLSHSPVAVVREVDRREDAGRC
jgi:nucleotide-binding universal stress UspA family protein